MRIDKYICDGCGKEYIDPKQFGIRLIAKNIEKGYLLIESDTTQIKVKERLDFCNTTCFQTYLDALTVIPEPEP